MNTGVKNKAKLTVVGAGPGAVDLITLKALKAIASADVILYDALINTELLEGAASHAEKIFVGKRRGCYSHSQDQINELIVSRAKSDGHVVRLKGGDPFVFGRGAEEMAHAKSFGIEVAMVPGISSSLAVPAYQNIPMTKRGISESFWVITGTTKEHKLSSDIALAAQSTATVVILMGMGKLHEITSVFKLFGKDATPVAVIQNGTMDNEKVAVGSVETITDLVREKEMANPAVIVIGEVVAHREQFHEVKNNIHLNSYVH